MLLSLLISITPVSAAPILGSLGRPSQAWFLRLLTQANPQLASRLHDSNGLKPYTVSTLLDDLGRPLPAGSWLQPGKSVWLRWTVFEPQLSELVQTKILKKIPAILSLYKMDFRLDGWTLDPAQHPWAGQTDYVNMAQRPLLTNQMRSVRMEFASPTAFRSEGADIPLPIPGHIFRGCWQKWNTFAPNSMRIHEIWPEFANSCIMVNELSAINSVQWSFAEGTHGAATGFTGVAGFTLLPRKHCGDFEAYWDGADRIMKHLTQFAFYCGVGHHTTVGMGQTRPFP